MNTLTLDFGGIKALEEVLEFVERYNKQDKEPLVASVASALQGYLDDRPESEN